MYVFESQLVGDNCSTWPSRWPPSKGWEPCTHQSKTCSLCRRVVQEEREWVVARANGTPHKGTHYSQIHFIHLPRLCSPHLFKKYFIYLFWEKGEGREKEGEKHQCVVASCTPPSRGLAGNPSMCLDWELNLWAFGLLASTQSTEPQQPALIQPFNLSSGISRFDFDLLPSNLSSWKCLKKKQRN